MNNLKLVTTETFGDLQCNFYRNMNDDILLTREQIGQALEYSNPIDAIYRIHKRHSDRIAKLSICLSDGFGHDIFYYNERGIMEICRWSRQPKANAFMDWVWDVVDQYRHNELISYQNLSTLTNKISSIANTLAAMEQTINSIKSNTEQPQLPKRKYSSWTSKMFPKYQLLMDYFHITRKDLYKNLFIELQNTYPDVDLNQEIDDYCYFNHVESAYTMEVIEHNSQLRTLFESVVNNLLLQHDLTDSVPKQVMIPTIFNTFLSETGQI